MKRTKPTAGIGLSYILIAAACGLALGVAFSAPADAEPYLQAAGGCIETSDTTNSDELEFGNECGAVGLVEAGWRVDRQTWAIDAGVELGYRQQDLHGQNKGGDRAGARRSADGETFRLGSAMLNLRFCTTVYGPVEVCSLVGAGGAYANGLDDHDATGAWQTGAELAWRVTEAWSVQAGYRYFKLLPFDLDGNRSKADFHGALVGFRYRWTPQPNRVRLSAKTDGGS